MGYPGVQTLRCMGPTGFCGTISRYGYTGLQKLPRLSQPRFVSLPILSLLSHQYECALYHSQSYEWKPNLT